jgi:RecA-family ATPase
MNIITAAQLIAMNIDKIPFLIENILPQGQVGCIVGPSDVGKSTSIRAFGLQIVGEANEILGNKVNATQRRVLFYSSEDDRTSTAFFLQKNNKHFNYPSDKIQRLEFVFEIERSFLSELEAHLKLVKYDLIILDNLADLFALSGFNSLNDATQVRNFLQPFSLIAERYGCTVVFIHHLKKGRENEEPTKNNINGSQAIEAKMRFLIEIRRDPNDQEKMHLCITKGNSFSSEQKEKSIELIRDENLVFHSTGKRVSLNQLVKGGNSEMYTEVKKLKQDGLTQAQIAEQLGYKSRSAISKILKK